MITVEIASDVEVFRLQSEWNALLRQSTSPSVFLTWEWVYSWISVPQNSRKHLILTVRDAGELVGIAPLLFENGSSVGRTLRLCGAEPLYADYLDFIARKGREADVVSSTFDYLAHRVNVNKIVLNYLAADALILGCRRELSQYYQIVSRNVGSCPGIKIIGSFEDYLLERFDRKKRYNLQRQVRVAINQLGLTHKRITHERDLKQALGSLFELHRRWKCARNVSSTFLSNDIRLFHFRAAQLMLRRKWLWLHFLCRDGTPVCAMYGYEYNNKIYYYQSGIAPEWEKYSLGSVLLMIVLQDAFERGVQEFDFLKGDESYKRAWANVQREEADLHLYRRNIYGAGRCLYDHCMSKTKHHLVAVKRIVEKFV